MKPASTALATWAALGCFALGCGQGGGSLHADWLEVADCSRLGEPKRYEPFDMTLEFATINQQLGAVQLRMSPSARLIEQGDQLVITLEAADDVKADIAADGVATLLLQSDGHGDADLSVVLLGRCAHATQALAAEGTLTLYELGWKSDSHVRGEVAFDLIDRRSGEIVGERFVGDFDFEKLSNSSLTAFAPRDY